MQREDAVHAERIYRSTQIRQALASQSALLKVIDESKGIREASLREGRNGCVKCFDSEISGLEINRILLSQLLELETPHVMKDESAVMIGKIDPVQVDEKILNPLSHQARLAVMLSIYVGENRFTDFIRKTGLTGGHLIYHLKRLEDNGFIQQFASKEYVLTSKGLNSLIMIANLNNMLK